MTTVCLHNCRLVDPDTDLTGAGLLLAGSRISSVIPPGAPLPAADQTLDLGGDILMPGFIDLHFHGAAGHDITDGSEAAVRAIAAAKLSEGVTTMVPATLTAAPATLEAAFKAVAGYRRNEDLARLPGVHLEGPFLNPACAGAQNPALLRLPDFSEVERLHRLAPVAMVSFAVELPGAGEFTAALRRAGIVASCGHSNATWAQLQTAKAAGVTNLTHFCNQMRPLHHREIGLVGAGLLDNDLNLELICDRIHLCPEMLRLVFKCRSVENLLLITDSVLASGLPDGDYSLGGLAITVRAGQARLAVGGNLAGSTLKFNQALRNAHEISGLPLSRLALATAANQARLLGLHDRGWLRPGHLADLVVMDADFKPHRVIVGGEPRFQAGPN